MVVLKTYADEHESFLGVFDDIDKIERYLKKYINRFGNQKTLECVGEGKYKIRQQKDGEPYHFWLEPIKINKGIL